MWLQTWGQTRRARNKQACCILRSVSQICLVHPYIEIHVACYSRCCYGLLRCFCSFVCLFVYLQVALLFVVDLLSIYICLFSLSIFFWLFLFLAGLSDKKSYYTKLHTHTSIHSYIILLQQSDFVIIVLSIFLFGSSFINFMFLF